MRGTQRETTFLQELRQFQDGSDGVHLIDTTVRGYLRMEEEGHICQGAGHFLCMWVFGGVVGDGRGTTISLCACLMKQLGRNECHICKWAEHSRRVRSLRVRAWWSRWGWKRNDAHPVFVRW